jgi:hypothetical protein
MDSTLPGAGSFYRVVGVSGPCVNSAQQAMILELRDRPKLATTNGSLTLFEHVVEVFEKGPGWLTN